MNNWLDILTQAISDVGYWQWWVENFPEYFQVEFGGTQLWNPPIAVGKPPSGQIALRFISPTSVSFLTKTTIEIQPNWPRLLQEDEIGPFAITYDSLTLSSIEVLGRIMNESAKIETVCGTDPKGINWSQINSKLGFWAGPVGLMIASDGMEIFNHEGIVSPEEVEDKHKQWWAYWKEYWAVKDSSKMLPYDYACEVTIPASDGRNPPNERLPADPLRGRLKRMPFVQII